MNKPNFFECLKCGRILFERVDKLYVCKFCGSHDDIYLMKTAYLKKEVQDLFVENIKEYSTGELEYVHNKLHYLYKTFRLISMIQKKEEDQTDLNFTHYRIVTEMNKRGIIHKVHGRLDRYTYKSMREKIEERITHMKQLDDISFTFGKSLNQFLKEREYFVVKSPIYVRDEILKRVVKRGNKWCVIHAHADTGGSRDRPIGSVIKCFPTRAQAEAMHRAIGISQAIAAGEFKNKDITCQPEMSAEIKQPTQMIGTKPKRKLIIRVPKKIRVKK